MTSGVDNKGEALFRDIVRSQVADALVIFERHPGSLGVRALVITATRSTVLWTSEAALTALQAPGSERVAAAITLGVKQAFGIA